MTTPLVLTDVIFFSLLRDTAFYQVLPPGFDFEVSGRRAHRASLEKAMMGGLCGKCGGEADSELAASMTEFGQRMKQALADDPQAGEPFRAYLGKRRGRTPSQIILYYREADEIANLSF